jgi:exopolysaccharide biosynthesis polyprenyl glycosylphosphotransferase
MQNDFEQGMQLVPIQNLYTAKHETVSIGRGNLPLVAELVDESQHLSSPDSRVKLGEVIQQPLVRELEEMRRRQKPSLTMWHITLKIGDIILLMASLAIILVMAPLFHLGLHVSWNEPKTWDLKLVWGCIALISWGVAVNITRAQELVSVGSRFKSSLNALFALIITLILWIVLTYPFIAGRGASSAVVLLLFLVVATPALSIWRITLAEIMGLPRFRRQGVIIGVNSAGETLVKEIRSTKRSSTNILGYISESVDENEQKDGLPILGGKSILRRLAQNGMIDMIIMAIDYKDNPALFKAATEAAQLGISVLPMAVFYESISGKIPVEHIGDQWQMVLPLEPIISPLYLCWRKVIDLACGFCGLLVLSLLLPVMALLIYLDSPGPIFYRQERLGIQGKPFRIYKFRSMRINAESAGQAVWAEKNDPRITKIGRFMRATHLDELPQVLNILRGDMSLLGPRPERAEFVIELEKAIPFYRCRLAVKPGLTGWAQVKYSYGNTDDDALAKLQYDLYYIKHQSFMLDVFIVLNTLIEVLLHRGV